MTHFHRHTILRDTTCLLFGMLVLLCSTSARAQNPAIDTRTAGLTYIIAFPDTTTNTTDTRQGTALPSRMPDHDAFVIYIYSAVNNNVRITGNGYSNLVHPQAGSPLTLYLNEAPIAPYPVVDTSFAYSDNTFRLEADYPIVIYCYMATRFGAEAWTPIPVESWGKEYYVAARPGEVVMNARESSDPSVQEYLYVKRPKAGPAEVLIVAAYDSTVVQIEPLQGPGSAAVRFDHYFPSAIVLNANEAFEMQSYVDTTTTSDGLPRPQPDIGGTHIRSNRPIGVISGNTRAQVVVDPNVLSGNSFKNMLIEWLTPTDQQGREFVYLPTIDPWTNLGSIRVGEHIRIYGTDGTTASTTVRNLSSPGSSPDQVKPGELLDYSTMQPVPQVFNTDRPAQAMMNSTAIIHIVGQNGQGTAMSTSLSSIGAYMVEMVPREQWPTAAPYVAPEFPPGMGHMLNIVTDTANADKIFLQNGSRITMNFGPIPGSRFCWGARQLQAGEKGVIHGADGATFYAYAYGFLTGWERFRPGKTRRSGDGGSPASTHNNGGQSIDSKILHPSEYEESLGISYGYPLAPTRTILRPADSLAVTRMDSCNRLILNVQIVNDDPAGFRSIALDSVDNAVLVILTPAPPNPVTGLTGAHLIVRPVDPTRNASAVVVIQDRTGKIWRIPYRALEEHLDFIPASMLDFGTRIVDAASRDSAIITNPTSRPVEIRGIDLAEGTEGYTIDSTRPSLPATLGPGETIKVWITSAPFAERYLRDTLRAHFDCGESRLPLSTKGVKPCLSVGDLNFGTFHPGEHRQLRLIITNKGGSDITFNAPFLTWPDASFDVSPTDIALLRQTTLKPGESITITVGFTAGSIGTFTTMARLWASTRSCRDTSIWTARVTAPGPYISGHDWDTVWVTNGNTCTKDTVREYPWDLYAFNSSEDDAVVESVRLIGPDADAGYFVLDVSNPATTIAPGSRLPHGDTVLNRPLQRVLFRPTEEREYECIVRLTTSGTSVNVVENVLHGDGVESHLTIGGLDFGNIRFTGNGTRSTGTVMLSAKPSRPLTVSDLQIIGPDRIDFAFDDPAFARPDPARPSTWWHLNPGEQRTIPLLFLPAAPGTRQAAILAVTDGSRCNDSTGALMGSSYISSVVAQGIDFGDILACDQHTAAVVLRNVGSIPVMLQEIDIAPTSGPFTMHPPTALPLILAPSGSPGDSLAIPVDFTPTMDGTSSATLTFRATGADGSTVITIPSATVTGRAFSLSGSTQPIGDRRTLPGAIVTIPVVLENANTAPVRADIRLIRLTVTYDPGTMLLDNGGDAASLLGGTLLDGWRIVGSATSTPGKYDATLASTTGAPLAGRGPLANLKFRTFLGSAMTSAVTYSLSVPGEERCITITPATGTMTIDSVCGLGFRLIEMTSGSKYSLERNRPNPFTPSTEIAFSIGLDGQTSLVIYNALGERIATLVDRYLQPGSYSVVWDAALFPSGLYYYRLNSGSWNRTGTMILRK